MRRPAGAPAEAQMPISFSSPPDRDLRIRGQGVTAVLGPTNTGKTHLAIERMLAHSSGLIGLPLRLLAREVYNKVSARAGADAVALITGEEKIKPANPRDWVSTGEAMPRDLDVAFVAVDEVQLGGDLERGHVFTDRMLNRRGREETLVLGAATVRPMVEKLLPGANILSRPRLSQLTHAGEKKITRQPRRTAIVAFSADEVYAIAELIRRQRGGAAVVLGALSPRTRNAQVALYQSGDVDYLVATDAIGMGLNLDVDHVAFASDRKFDGYQFRRLNPAEFAQVAGRAGRATRDGTFGTTGRCPPFDAELVRALESHSFEPVKVLQWRNAELDFSSLGALAASLAMLPPHPGLTRAPLAEDILVFEHAARDEDIRELAKGRAAIERLWDVCQIPDYRKISPAAHAELVATLFGFLLREGRIPDDWFARQIAQADHVDGDIDTLSTRIAHIRTWTFAANRSDWLGDPDHWQGMTRAIEDRLSDALHERLAERFIDRRTSVLMRRLRENTMLDTEITKTGEVVVEGHPIGRLDGFRFAPDATQGGSDAKALSAAAQKALAGEIEARANRLAHAPDAQFVLTSDATIRWLGDPVAKILPGDMVLRPRVRILADEQLTGAALEAAQTRLDLWTRTHIERLLGPLFVLSAAEDITGLARGIAYQLVEALGILERGKVAEELKSVDQPSRAVLRKHGVRFGAYHVYIPLQLKPAPRALAAQLWALKHGGAEIKGLDELQRLAASGRTSFAADKEVPRPFYRILGYRVCGERSVRVDILERLADLIRPALAWRPGSSVAMPGGAFDGGGFTVTQAMTSLTGCSGEDFASILRSLGYWMEKRPKPQVVQTTPAAAAASTFPAAEASPADDIVADGSLTDRIVTEDSAPGVTAAEPHADHSVMDSAVAEMPAGHDLALGEEIPLETAGREAEHRDATDIGEPQVPTPEPADRDAVPRPERVADAAPSQDDIAAPRSDPSAEPMPHSAAGIAPEEPVGTSEPESAAPSQSAGAEAAAEASSATAAAEPGLVEPGLVQPELVEVWKPGGRSSDERHPQRRPPRRHHRDGPRPARAGVAMTAEAAPAMPDTAAAAATEAGLGAPDNGGGTEAPATHRRARPPGEYRRGRAEGSAGRHSGEGADAKEARRPGDHGPREGSPGERKWERPRERQGQGSRPGERADHVRGERPERRAERSAFAKNNEKDRRDYAPRRERDKQPDPDSPFAKLAALKAQLEANAKER
jgi:ATP-dependent RNA helicase SUPV3L1/SUV3